MLGEVIMIRLTNHSGSIAFENRPRGNATAVQVGAHHHLPLQKSYSGFGSVANLYLVLPLRLALLAELSGQCHTVLAMFYVYIS